MKEAGACSGRLQMREFDYNCWVLEQWKEGRRSITSPLLCRSLKRRPSWLKGVIMATALPESSITEQLSPV